MSELQKQVNDQFKKVEAELKEGQQAILVITNPNGKWQIKANTDLLTIVKNFKNMTKQIIDQINEELNKGT